MKKDIHPKYNGQVTIKCGCGATFVAGSTKDGITTEICSNCHPFYTGKQKLVDTAGRVEKFEAKRKAAEAKQVKKDDGKKGDDDDDDEKKAEKKPKEKAPEETEDAAETPEKTPEETEETEEPEETPEEEPSEK